MNPIVTIGTFGFDAVHLGLLALALILIGVAIRQTGKAKSQTRELQREVDYTLDALTAEKSAANELRQQLTTQTVVAQQAREDLARREARSEEDEKKFAELAQGVLRRANSQFLELADEHFKRHKEGAQTNLKELITPVSKNLEEFRDRESPRRGQVCHSRTDRRHQIRPSAPHHRDQQTGHRTFCAQERRALGRNHAAQCHGTCRPVAILRLQRTGP